MKGRFVDIYVEPDSTATSGYKFSMEDGKGQTSTLVFNKNTDNMKKSDDYKVEFKLHNQKGAKLCFSKDKSMVLWAEVVTGTPPHPCPAPKSSCSEFYLDPTAYIEDRLLTVINTDKTVQDISFALNFLEEGQVDGPDAKYICYDPIVSNQNGGRTSTSNSSNSGSTARTAFVAVGIIAVGAAVLYAFGVFGS